ncbi:hypothetical protein SUGI_0950770 [Cryptomeria japonica]|uniref:cyclin-T1-3 n=1 Tax=Cryptomeria japonica TaxID=3369 RepID=UPI00241475B0|nr:cyclin-T1-3 [Cryptomeria japonica]XP_057843129.2 cyclin-T1-3 [Cryptomeria japonica]XP_057843130.2 cyclin-T1-3 [Cryptomeria japonica]XP_057843131.2 cyclin-T1-3 [Cryptomeria japonica]XP_057843132.2 cyclin-T1-3 [Cryptomeria japonica]GLJ45170.1 hypothetical protein SUGI_0950770 [Cryptomeria japonica]
MAGFLSGDPSQVDIAEGGTNALAHTKLEEPDHSSSNWYFSRQEIEENSPSRKDTIDLKKEAYFRKSYCTFLQDLGMRLKVPQVTIATAIIFCHRFFHRQSLAKNDRRTIATVCMFLAGKVEETPRPLKDVILLSYEICNKKDPAAVQRIKQKDIYEQQKELIITGERVVLATLGFDLNVHHPYKPLVAAIKKFKVAQNALAQVAWNFVNDGLRTSLCLQFKPHHIAAGAIFLAAKFLKVKLPSDGEKVWWQEFAVTPRQLEEVSNQMLELYEQNRTVPPSRGSEPDGSIGATNRLKPGNTQLNSDELPSANGHSQTVFTSAAVQTTSGPPQAEDAIHAYKRDACSDPQNTEKNIANISNVKQNMAFEQAYSENQRFAEENVNTNQASGSTVTKYSLQDDRKHDLDPLSSNGGRDKADEADNIFKLNKTKHSADDYESKETEDRRRDVQQGQDNNELQETKSGDETRGCPGSNDTEPKKSYEINKEYLKAIFEKRKRSRGELTDSKPTISKADDMDEDDLIERELEIGVMEAAEAEKVKQERRDVWSKSSSKLEQEVVGTRKERLDGGDNGGKQKRPYEENISERKRAALFDATDRASRDHEWDQAEFPYDRTEEGELPDTTMHEQVQSPKHSERRSSLSAQLEKAGSPANRRDYGVRDQHGYKDGFSEKQRHNYHHHQHSYHQQHQHRTDSDKDRQHYKERDHKRARHDHAK